MRYVRLTIDIGFRDRSHIWQNGRSLRWWVWLDAREALLAYLLGDRHRLVSIREISKREFMAKRKEEE